MTTSAKAYSAQAYSAQAYSAQAYSASPDSSCSLCPRLVDFRKKNKEALPAYHNAPVTSFGDTKAPFLIVGLAPGLHGANQTGRPFTGDYAGDLLYETLLRFGFAKGSYAQHAEDGLQLQECRITNAVRCVPPQNKPTPQEIKTCRGFLVHELESMLALKCLLVLGRIAHTSILSTLGLRQKDFPFTHGAQYDLPHGLPGSSSQTSPLRLFSSYHCSRYNTQTRRLTPAMFEAVFADIKTYVNGKGQVIASA